MRFIILCLILTVCYSRASAITVSGTVTDEKNEPLPYTAVYIQGTTTGTATNGKGYYQLNLDAGSYKLVFQMISYKKHIESILDSSAPLTINVKLYPEEITLREVVVK